MLLPYFILKFFKAVVQDDNGLNFLNIKYNLRMHLNTIYIAIYTFASP